VTTLPARLLGAIVWAAVGAALAAQAPATSARVFEVFEIRSPTADAYLAGPVVLQAVVEPPAAAAKLVFFVDGREVCVVDRPPFECEWDAGQNVVERQVRVLATFSDGSRLARTVRTQGLGVTEKVDVDIVQVTVTVTNDRGEFVAGLPQSAFHVMEDGKPQTITYFASEDVPLELIVAVDISGSMAPVMPKLREAVKAFLGAVPAENRLSLLGFNDSVFALTRRPTDPPEERMRAVDRLAPWGATALYDVIVRGIDMLGTRSGRKALVVFSDGEDQGSHVTLDQVEQRLQASDVTLYMIGQGRGLSVERLKKIMERLSMPTGGRVFAMSSINELSGAFDTLLDELSHQYLIGYPPPGDIRDGKFHEIKVRVDGHKHVRARNGYRFTARP
jgi:Ca-activated chloride channel family protein